MSDPRDRQSIFTRGAVDLGALRQSPPAPAGPARRGRGPGRRATRRRRGQAARRCPRRRHRDRRHRGHLPVRGAGALPDHPGGGRLLGRVVRPVQAALAGAGEARGRGWRRVGAGQGRRRQQPAARPDVPGAEHPDGVRGGRRPAGRRVHRGGARGAAASVDRRRAQGRRRRGRRAARTRGWPKPTRPWSAATWTPPSGRTRRSSPSRRPTAPPRRGWLRWGCYAASAGWTRPPRSPPPTRPPTTWTRSCWRPTSRCSTARPSGPTTAGRPGPPHRRRRPGPGTPAPGLAVQHGRAGRPGGGESPARPGQRAVLTPGGTAHEPSNRGAGRAVQPRPAPADRRASVPGCAKAPGALRDHGLVARLGARDAGCLTPPRYDPGGWRPGDGVCQAAAIAAYSLRLADRIGAIIDADELPVVLGGDCSILIGSAVAMHRLGEAVGGRTGLVFVDGHSDFRHPGNAPYVGRRRRRGSGAGDRARPGGAGRHRAPAAVLPRHRRGGDRHPWPRRVPDGPAGGRVLGATGAGAAGSRGRPYRAVGPRAARRVRRVLAARGRRRARSGGDAGGGRSRAMAASPTRSWSCSSPAWSTTSRAWVWTSPCSTRTTTPTAPTPRSSWTRWSRRSPARPPPD